MHGVQLAEIRAFVAVAEHCSFTKAAAHLGISTAAISKTIRALEERFTVRLFNRTTRGVAPTEAGEQMLGHFRPILDSIGIAVDAVNAFRNKPDGKLRLRVEPAAAIMIAPLLVRFAAAFPTIRIEVAVEDSHKDLIAERFDAGVQLRERIDRDMIAVPIGERLKLVAAAAPAYLNGRAAPKNPDELRAHNCVRYRRPWDGTLEPWTFQRESKRVETPVDGTWIVNNLELALLAGLDGLGIVQLPENWVAPFIARQQLVPLLEDWSAQWSRFFLFYPSRRHVPAPLRSLIDFARGAPPAPARREETTVSWPAAGAHAPRPSKLRVEINRDGGNLAAACG